MLKVRKRTDPRFAWLNICLHSILAHRKHENISSQPVALSKEFCFAVFEEVCRKLLFRVTCYVLR